VVSVKRPVDLKQLQHFVAVYDYGSLLSAANHVGVGQSALTKSLKKLEEHLGLQLFARHTRELTPTAPGHQLYQKALQVIAEADDLLGTADQLVTGEQGAVNIGCGCLPADILLVPMIQSLQTDGADINIKVVTDDFDKLIHGLLTYQYDFLLFETRKLDELPEPERFRVTPLVEIPLEVVLNKALYDTINKKDPFTSLTQLKWASTSQQPPQKFMDQFPEPVQLLIRQNPQAHFQIENIQTCLDLAKAGLAATIAPQRLVAEDIASDALHKVKLPFKLSVHIGAYQLRARGNNSSVQKVIRAFQNI
jgi:DNA-binding transcriptional LysR family regulator